MRRPRPPVHNEPRSEAKPEVSFRKQREEKDDGRYIIFYSFDESDGDETSGEGESS